VKGWRKNFTFRGVFSKETGKNIKQYNEILVEQDKVLLCFLSGTGSRVFQDCPFPAIVSRQQDGYYLISTPAPSKSFPALSTHRQD
jgi:hypothetical protein